MILVLAGHSTGVSKGSISVSHQEGVNISVVNEVYEIYEM
jgi:hypothetical protein